MVKGFRAVRFFKTKARPKRLSMILVSRLDANRNLTGIKEKTIP